MKNIYLPRIFNKNGDKIKISRRLFTNFVDRDIHGSSYVLDDIRNEFTEMSPLVGSIACKVKENGEKGVSRLETIRHLLRYKFLSLFSYNKRVLDCACGCGYGSYILSKNAKEVAGIDLDSTLIEFANKYNRTPNINFFLSNIEQFTNGTFDLVVSVETFEHISPDKIDSFVSGLSSVVKHNGLIVITTPRIRKTRVYSDGINFRKLHSHYKEYDKNDFVDVLIRNGLSVNQYLLQKFDGNFVYQIPKNAKFYDNMSKAWVQIAICSKEKK